MLHESSTIPTEVSSYRVAGHLELMEAKALQKGHEAEVIEFLRQRPIHTVAMISLIQDNGLESPLNRGTFYGCRDLNGQLEGVALVGHATLMETVSDRALQALAQVARRYSSMHMIMGEQDRVAEFWTSFADTGRQPRLACREWLMELPSTPKNAGPAPNLRPATEEELDLVMPIQAKLALEESGVDPMKSNPEAFRKRCLRRIHQGRTWVLIENGSLIFKADVISETSDVIYLEGIWVKEDCRNSNSGFLCLTELSRKLLVKTNSICLLVNELNLRALAFYRKCGFLFRATYETIFLTQKESLTH
jgi:uncharacterized protein